MVRSAYALGGLNIIINYGMGLKGEMKNGERSPGSIAFVAAIDMKSVRNVESQSLWVLFVHINGHGTKPERMPEQARAEAFAPVAGVNKQHFHLAGS